MMQFKLSQTDEGQVSLKVSGEMTVFYAAESKQALLAPLADFNELEVDLSAVEEIDTAGLQLLMLLKNEAQKQQKTLSLTRHSQAVIDMLDISHLHGFFGDPVLLHSTAAPN